MRKSSNNQWLLALSGKMQRWAQFFSLYPCPLQDDFAVPPTKRSRVDVSGKLVEKPRDWFL